MKVLVVPSWYPSKSYPNNGSFFKEQIEALKNSGVDVTVLCIDIPYRKTKKDFKYFIQNSYVENGVKVIRYVLPLSFLHRMPKLYYGVLKNFSKYVYRKLWHNHGFDVVQAHSFLIGGYVALHLKKLSGCKCVITEHTSKILLNALNSTEKAVLKECVEKSDAFVCVSNNLKKNVKTMTNSSKDILVYPNLLNSQFEFQTKNMEGEFVISSIGNLIPLKRMDLLIDAFCRAFSSEDKVRLEIVGAGIEHDKLVKMINKSERESQIVLRGLLSRQEVGGVLQKSHVMALLSEKETFGVSYIEALATGNVIIGVDNGGANDIVTKENGVIAHYSDAEEIAKTLRLVYENYSTYEPKKISEMCVERYGEIAFSKFYKQLFKTL